MADLKCFSISNTYANHYSHVFLKNKEFEIVSREEDDSPPEYFFASDYLTELEDPNEIWGKGLFLLNLYNGAVNINLIDHDWDSQVTFNKLYNWVTDEDLTPSSTDILPVNPFPETIVADNTKKQSLKSADFISYSAFLSKSEKDVQSLLLLAGNKLNWISLYAIYDTLKYFSSDFDTLVSSCGYDRNNIKAFTGTANNFGLLGINARHGELGWGKPTQTMTLVEAKKLMLKLAKKHIEEK